MSDGEPAKVAAARVRGFHGVFIGDPEVLVGLFHGRAIYKFMITAGTTTLGNHQVAQFARDFPGNEITADTTWGASDGCGDAIGVLSLARYHWTWF